MNSNLHADCTNRTHEGPPMLRCEKCGEEFSGYHEAKLCPDCVPEPDNEDISGILQAMRAGHWPPLRIKPITTVLKKLT